VVLLILESLGSTELLFILVMALVFFGPRKLPQLSRSLGKNLAEFRKASEDFKRTWEKEVRLEESDVAVSTTSRDVLPPEHSILETEKPGGSLQAPVIEAVAPDRVVARHTAGGDALASTASLDSPADGSDYDDMAEEPKPSAKHDWL
jgi:Tat protein translocase TatB subunit